MSVKMRKGLIAVWLLLLFIAVAGIFWYTEWKYTLPTPVPSNYSAVSTGTKLDLKLFEAGKPNFLHFFNPDCPCSKFNMKHFRELVQTYKGEVNFTMVLMTDKSYTEKEIQEKYDLDIPVVQDTTIAKICGVYSTPQAVLLNENKQLYYRGNYNRTRYCTDKKSNYAQQALEQLLQHKPLLKPAQFALKAYGCQLPNCNKN